MQAFEGKIYLQDSGMSGDARIHDKGLWLFDRNYPGIPPVGDARATAPLDHPLLTYDKIGAEAGGPWSHNGVYWTQPAELMTIDTQYSAVLVDPYNRKLWSMCSTAQSSAPGGVVSIDLDDLPATVDPVTRKPAGLRRYGCALTNAYGSSPVGVIVPHVDDVNIDGTAKGVGELLLGFVRTYLVRVSGDIGLASASKVIVLPLWGLTENADIKPNLARYHTTQADGARSVAGSALHGHYPVGSMRYHHPSRAIICCNIGRTNNYGTASDFGGQLRVLAVPDDPMNAVEADWRWRIVSVDNVYGVPTPSSAEASTFRGTYSKSGIIDDMGNGQSLVYIVSTWDVPTWVCKLPAGGV
jgi:hypothetical protein